jgi:endonuclease-8
VPEGDTIHRTAARLRPALTGRRLVRFEAPRVPRPHPPPGTVVDAVEARGKHLLIRFSTGEVLETHLRMTGSWHLYRPGARWAKPAQRARAVLEVEGLEVEGLEVDGWVAVCFSAPVVRLTTTPATGHLGPDLCLPEADLEEVVRRMGSVPEPGTALADVLLDQRICCGVGNVYKSEVCFACGVHPLTPVERVGTDARRRLAATAHRLLRANLGGGPRTTVPGPPGGLAVYGRARRPCRRCGTPIVGARTGPQARATFWCPRCQPEPP